MTERFQLAEPDTAAIPLTVLAERELEPWLASAPAATAAWVKSQGFKGRAGEICAVPGPGGHTGRVLVGRAADTADIWRLAALPTALPLAIYRLDGGAEPEAAALGWALGAYRFERYKEDKRPRPHLAWPAGIDRGAVLRLAAAIHRARDLVNTPAGDLGPSALAAAAQEVGHAWGAKVTVTVGEALLEQGYRAIHAVGRAAADPPRLIDLVWGDEAAPKLTLVGKGVCFDTGGLDLKTAGGMQMMKKDMGGAATALGLAEAIMGARLPVRLRVLIPAVENAVSGNAYRPLDVIPGRNGKTIEIGNTDAEGRVILSDALVEASREKPALLLDFATLTGAARVALGPELPAMFANDETLAEALLRHGQEADDPMWRLPLWPGYRSLVEGTTADLNNAPEGGMAGAITAALFLEAFVEKGIAWAHFDTYAWNQKTRPGRPKGGEALLLRACLAMIREKFG
ncbi:MAG: leucyl aminopeptidase family protein [Rhodospirillaceae bacterium]|nr:leucyl aminopeptidase family protein [Rhodospirillaceae bacterium]